MFDPANALAQTRSRVYSNLNRLFQEIGAQAQTTEYGYDAQGNVTSVKDPLNRITANAYDALNRLRQVTDPANGVTTYGYNGLDALTQVTDPRALVTGYTVDGLGNLTQQVSPDTGATASTYDAAGNLLTQTDAKGQTTSYAYDALNRVTSITFHDGSKQTYAYDQGTNGIGRLSSITETNPASQVTSLIQYAYDPHGRATSETRTIGGVAYATGYSYDSAGRMSGMSYPSGRALAYAFDALGRVSQVTTTKGSQTQVLAQNVQYHPFGGAKSWTLGNGQVYVRGIDLDGRVASYTLGAQTYALGYDAASRIAFITDMGNPANSNTYGYDSLDRLTQAVLPGTPFAYSYDAAGNRLTKTIGAATESYVYSTISNRLAAIVPASGPVRNVAFDANGSASADGLNTYAYDTRGRMVQAVSTLGTTAYQVNALGQRIAKTVPGSGQGGAQTCFADSFPGPEGRPIDDQADGLWKGGGRKQTVATVQQGQAEIAPPKHIRSVPDCVLGAQGLVLTAKLARGTVALTNSGREEDGVVVRYAGGGEVVVRARDDDGDEQDDDAQVKKRFTLATAGAALGVRIELKPGSARVRITAGAQVLDTGELALPEVRAGERYRVRLGAVKQKRQALSGRIDDVVLASAGGAAPAVVTNFMYDVRGRLIGEYTAQGVPIREYAWMNDLPLAVAQGGGIFYAHPDHLNTPRLVANDLQQTIWRWDQQEPFGVNVPDENPSGLGTFEFPLRFPGQYADKETGLHYSYFRDYDPGLGRFPQFDPIGLRGGINGYAYADLNPLSKTDPFGLAAQTGGAGNKKADCGPEGGWLNRFVPNNPGGYPFQNCCDAHDKCYDKCFGPDKLSCDADACDCFKKACGSSGSATATCLRIAQEYCYRIIYSETADEQFKKARAKCKSSSACIPSPTL